jgi:hypothetical protein
MTFLRKHVAHVSGIVWQTWQTWQTWPAWILSQRFISRFGSGKRKEDK